MIIPLSLAGHTHKKKKSGGKIFAIAIDSDKSLNVGQKGSGGHPVTPEPSSHSRHVDLGMFFALKRIHWRQKKKKKEKIF